VDKLHAGKTDSSVMYIPACPLTEANAEYLVRQREAFFGGMSITWGGQVRLALKSCAASGVPAPDIPSGEGEGQFMGRLTTDYVMQNIDLDAQRALGLARYDSDAPGLLPQERETMDRANEILGFA